MVQVVGAITTPDRPVWFIDRHDNQRVPVSGAPDELEFGGF